MAEGITLATAITIRPIVRSHKILTLTTAVLVTSCVPMVANDQRSSTADAGNFRKLSICLVKGLAGDLSNGVPHFVYGLTGMSPDPI